MIQYLELLRHIKNNGTIKQSARKGMPNTIGVHGHMFRADLSDGFPLLTTKKMYFKGILTELLWFMSGNTNIKPLVDNNCNIWTPDCYKWFKKNNPNHGLANIQKIDGETDEEYDNRALKLFSDTIKENPMFAEEHGDLGRVYGAQWRKWRGLEMGSGGQMVEVYYDQVKELIHGLKNSPYSRYHIISGWNPTDLKHMALPPCHLLYQFHCKEANDIQRTKWLTKNKNNNNIPIYVLDLTMYQRSADSFLGVPFNIASMATMLEILAKMTNMIAGEIVWIGGDVHVYENHIEQINTQLERKPFNLPQIIISDEVSSIDDPINVKPEHIQLVNYKSHNKIVGKLSVGS
jgi:thymidylate synthase